MFKIQSIYINPTGVCSMTKGSGKIYRVYKNPNARDLFLKAQKAETVEERTRLFNEMGDYEIITERAKQPRKNRFMQFLKGLIYAN